MTETEEQFDVVDDQDQVIDCLSRSEVHARNLFHRSVHALVFDSNHRIFLQHRTDDRDCDPGLWDSSVGGHLQSGEDYDEAVIREVEEEIGIRLDTVPEKLFKLNASKETAYEFCWIYRVYNDGPFRLDPGEATEGRWFSRQELKEWMASTPETITSSFRLIWKTYMELEPQDA